jgi:hypothetical protein
MRERRSRILLRFMRERWSRISLRSMRATISTVSTLGCYFLINPSPVSIPRTVSFCAVMNSRA